LAAEDTNVVSGHLQTGAGFWADAKAGSNMNKANWRTFMGWDLGWVKVIKVNVTEKGTSSLFCTQHGYSRQNGGFHCISE